jgi:large subunit ribosomal protein L18
MDTKVLRRQKLRFRIRKTIKGTATRPRLSVFRSNNEIYAQIIDDVNGKTLASAASSSKALAGSQGNKVDKSKMVGTEIAKVAIAKGIKSVVFDRSGYLYHGRIKSLAEGAREGGLEF